MDASRKKQKGKTPSREDASMALKLIKSTQKENDEDLKIKREQEEFVREQEEFAAKERAQIQLIQEQIKRKLRENLKNKEKKEFKLNNTKILELSAGKIKWISDESGNIIKGYHNKKLLFEIKRGLSLFSLYIRDKEKIKKSYLSCSTNVHKLKAQSEKLI